MSVRNHELWRILEDKATAENSFTASAFGDAVWQVCQYGIDLSKTIRDTFQTYTLHDEIHICNVMTIMLQLIGNLKSNLTRDECAILIMAACCHDVGMSVTDEEKTYLQSCPDCMQIYLEEHPKDYSIAYKHGLHEEATITNEILQHYIRTNHHKRVYEQLKNLTWPEILGRSLSIGDLISVCQNHGEDATAISQLQRIMPNLDLCLCAVLLRLGDILDFDATRAPDALYRYINLAHLDGMENEKSRIEWQKHQASRGFTFVSDNLHTLLYRAECTSIQVEQAIVSYLNWIDTELSACAKIIRYMEPRWRTLMLPGRVQRQITAKGYLSGEYKLTLDQERVLDLLVGREIYSDPAVFVRELIQNSIDAVRTRKQMDKNLPHKWTPQINICTWVDNEGYYWFRIEDNGIGMTEQTIKEYFLKIGHSYYSSDQFQADKIRCGVDISYRPISRFGIGILSCFMGDPKNNRVEVTTKHFAENGVRYPAYRLSIHGINGYYYIANDSAHRTMALEMPNNPPNGQSFISSPGTIIAVRTNLYQSGGARSFKDIIDNYIVYPEIPIHYEGIEGVYNYKTEQEFIDTIQTLTPWSKDGIYYPVERIPLPENFYSKLSEKYPELIWEEQPNISIYCLPLNYFTHNPLIKGVTVLARVEGTGHWQAPGLDKKYVPKVKFYLNDYSVGNEILLHVHFVTSYASENNLKEHVLPAINAQIQQMGLHFDSDSDVLNYFHRLPPIAFHDFEDVSMAEIRAYQSTIESFTFALSPDIFEQFPWFQSLFSQYFKLRQRNNQHSISINAHNGIFIDSSSILAFGGSVITNTILMLKDECSPTLNLSRNAISDLPLEAIYNLEALADCIQHSLKTSQPNYHNHALIPLKDYLDFLKSASFPSSKLHFSTNLGNLSLLQIKLALEKHEKLVLKGILVNTFHIAALLQQFDLKVAFTKNHGETTYIVKEGDTTIKEKLLSFPPALFVSPLSDDSIAMGVGSMSLGNIYIRRPYNALHPFSKWLIQNQIALQKFVPGIYNQIINQLQLEENVIDRVNTSLSLLRKIPYLRIEIPQDLTLDDFLII